MTISKPRSPSQVLRCRQYDAENENVLIGHSTQSLKFLQLERNSLAIDSPPWWIE